MNSKQYIKLAQRTSSTKNCNFETKLDHGTDGLVTEAGEAKDTMKRRKFYGTQLDLINIKEELGDIMWYIAEVCAACDWTFEEIMKMNIAKLRERYPEKFTKERATNRNLKKERMVLEK